MKSRGRILVIDDDKDIRKSLSRQLTRLGFACETAADGLDGLESLKAKEFDVALVDLDMPRMHGLELLDALQAAKIRTVAVILSACGDVPKAMEAAQLGAFDFIEKPGAPEIIERTLDRAILHGEALRRAEQMAGLAEQWELVFDAARDPILVLDEEQRIIRCNRALTEHKGVSKERLVGRNCHEALCGDEHPPESCPFARDARDEKRTSPECEMWGRIYELTSAPLTDRSGKTWGSMHIARDITKRKILEMQLAQAQKLEAIGQLAAGIAHEINTPTQYVGDNTRFLQESFADLAGVLRQYDRLLEAAEQGTLDAATANQAREAVGKADVAYLLEEIPRAIEQSLEGIGRVAGIVRSMKEFSHPGGEGKTDADINRAIENTITVSRNEWKYVAEVVTELDPALPSAPCLPGEFNQVILNLIVNAAQAIAEVVGDGSVGKGKITVSTKQDGDWVEIRISDTGPGIPEAIRDRIFTPFFTTKGVGKGTGQGLAISRSVVVDKHGGTIRFETTEGKGTTFIIRLPLGAGR